MPKGGLVNWGKEGKGLNGRETKGQFEGNHKERLGSNTPTVAARQSTVKPWSNCKNPSAP